jgi:hypothetical protein
MEYTSINKWKIIINGGVNGRSSIDDEFDYWRVPWGEIQKLAENTWCDPMKMIYIHGG